MRRLKLGDRVVVISGDDSGKVGKVKAIVAGGQKVVVEGLNRVKKHLKPQPTRPGGILDIEAPMNASKVMLIDPGTGKRTRARYPVIEGKRVRVGKSGDPIVAPGEEPS